MTSNEPPASVRPDLDRPLPPEDAQPAPIARPLDPVAVAELWADQFRHLTTLGVAGAGGVLVMLEADIIAAGASWWRVLALFVLSVAFSMDGQMSVIDRATTGSPLGRKPRILRALAVASLGAAAGAVVGVLAGR